MPTSPGVRPLSTYVRGVLLRCPIEYGHVNVSIRCYFRRNALVCSVISLPDAWYLADTHGHPLLNLIKARISLLPSTVVASGRVAEAYSDILQGIKAITRQILNGVAIQYAASHHPRLILPWCLMLGFGRHNKCDSRRFDTALAAFDRPRSVATRSNVAPSQPGVGPVRRCLRSSDTDTPLASLRDLTRGAPSIRLIVGFAGRARNEQIRRWLFEAARRPRLGIDNACHFPVRAFTGGH